MIDQSTETLISFADAAKLLPTIRGGKRPHASCLYRWSTTGCRGIVLDSVAIGGARCTSRESLDRFFSALTDRSVGQAVKPTPKAAKNNQRHEASDRRLVAKGL